jgi:hypothetical protein
MTVRDIVSPLVAQVVEDCLVELNIQLREVRSSFVAHGQFGSSRMALSAREACEASARKIAESIVAVFEEVINADRIPTSEGSEAEAKDAFMSELSAAVARVEIFQKDNSGQYFQPISLTTLSNGGLAKISNLFCASRNAKAKASMGLALSGIRALGSIWRSVSGLWK